MQRAGARDRRRDRSASRRRFRPTSSTKAGPSSRWLADNHFTFLGYRRHDLATVERPGRAAHRPGLEPRHPAREGGEGRRRELRRAAAGGPRVRAPARAAGRHQVDVALDRAPAGLSRLHRGQALRRRRQRRRRGPLPRPVHVDGVQREPRRHSAAAAQGRQRRRARGPRRRQPRRQGAAQHPRDVSARRAVPDRRRRPAAHGDGHPASGRPPALPPVRAARSVRALRVVPHLRAARELHDRPAPEVAGDPDAGVQRHELRVQRQPVRVDARAHPHHGAHDARRDPRLRRARARGAARRGGAALDRRPEGGAGRDARRGARQRALPPLRRTPSRPATARSSPRAPRCPTSR